MLSSVFCFFFFFAHHPPKAAMVTINIEIAGARGTVDVDLSVPLGTAIAQGVTAARGIGDTDDDATIGIEELIFRFEVDGFAPASWVWVVLGGAFRAFSALSVRFLFLLPLCGVKRPALRGVRRVLAFVFALLIAVRVLVFVFFLAG